MADIDYRRLADNLDLFAERTPMPPIADEALDRAFVNLADSIPDTDEGRDVAERVRNLADYRTRGRVGELASLCRGLIGEADPLRRRAEWCVWPWVIMGGPGFGIRRGWSAHVGDRSSSSFGTKDEAISAAMEWLKTDEVQP